jgi:hypothetical protein
MAFTGCSQKRCPKPIYPTLKAISKIPQISIEVKDGQIIGEHTLKVFNTVKALRRSEEYYNNLVVTYTEKYPP